LGYAARPSSADPIAVPAALLRLLLVEDDLYLRDTIALLLEAPDRQVLACGSAEEALACLAQHAFDVLITDISLPGLSGTELARRALQDHAATWVVLSSGYPTEHGVAQLGPRARALPKPFEPAQADALLDEIRAALGR
jgi:CheY-like chemotaxis protein